MVASGNRIVKLGGRESAEAVEPFCGHPEGAPRPVAASFSVLHKALGLDGLQP